MLLFASTIFLASFLLFLVQPLIAKLILPWFGGSAGVWSTCLVFFQAALVAGYFYSDWIVRHLRIRQQAWVHFGLLIIAVALLPIVPDAHWKPRGDESPSVRIVLLLGATVGLPYFLLATTSPLLQSWFARTFPERSPYRLFALSNFASMLALLGYPFLIEPFATTHSQAMGWSIGFAAFVLLCGATLWHTLKTATATAESKAVDEASVGSERARPVTGIERLIWIALAALGSALLLGVTNHMTQNISSIPLLWVLPLAIYLLTFILAFAGHNEELRWWPRSVALALCLIALGAMGWLIADKKRELVLSLQLGVFSAGLFFTCLYAHGELARRKPAREQLTNFYLMIAIGGAIGAFMVGIIAPLTLPAYYEFGFTLYLLAVVVTWLALRAMQRVWATVGAVMSLGLLGVCLYAIMEFREDVVFMSRNFYGTLRVKESGPAVERDRKRWLMHGVILHGDQYLDPVRKLTPTTYYRDTSGVGVALREKQKEFDRPLRVGVIGLGTGTIAAYGRSGDVYRFYEINPDVVAIARRDFSYLRDTQATIEIALGDARLSLEREAPERFDVLAIDAFSSDSIPVHLITLEAMAVYERHMHDDGIIAFHVSNRYLELHPVVERIAIARGLHTTWVEEVRDDGGNDSDWVLVAKDASVLQRREISDYGQPIPTRLQWRMWTDDFNNLLQVLK